MERAKDKSNRREIGREMKRTLKDRYDAEDKIGQFYGIVKEKSTGKRFKVSKASWPGQCYQLEEIEGSSLRWIPVLRDYEWETPSR